MFSTVIKCRSLTCSYNIFFYKITFLYLCVIVGAKKKWGTWRAIQEQEKPGGQKNFYQFRSCKVEWQGDFPYLYWIVLDELVDCLCVVKKWKQCRACLSFCLLGWKLFVNLFLLNSGHLDQAFASDLITKT